MTPVLIAPYQEIATSVAERLTRASRDPLMPWPEEILVPSRGVADAISAAVVARAGRGIAALQVRYLDELARAIVNDAGEFPRVASEMERRLAMRMAVRAIDDDLLDGRGMASMLERSYRDLRDSGLTLAESSTRGLRNPRRTQTILRAFAEYERIIARLGAIDPADLLANATRRIGTLPPQLLAGFYDMTGAQLKFVQALIDANAIAGIWVPTDMPFAQPFLDRVQGSTVSVERGEPSEDVLSFETRHDELRATCAEIASLLREGECDIAITARSLDPYDVRLINRFAAEQGFRTSHGDDLPLTAHRIGRGVVTLLRIRERGFPRAEVLELVRDGLQTRTRIDADASDYETRRARIAGGTSAELAPMRNGSRPIESYIDLVAELEELTASLDVDRLAGLFRVETEQDLRAAGVLDEIAVVFRRAGAMHDWLSVIDAIEHALLPWEIVGLKPDLHVWLGDVMRFRGRTFRHLFVVRMQDDVFPQRRVEDPLFPDADRRLLGMRTIGDGADEEHLLLQLIRDSAAHVHYSFAIGDGFGKVLRGSRFVRNVGPASARLAERRAEARPTLRALQMLVRAGTKSVFDGYLPGLDVAAKLQALSPTMLEDFGECPQKFFLKHLLGVEDLDQPDRELQINPRDKGTLDHRILERFHRATTPDEIAIAAAALPRIPEAMVARLEEVIDQTFDEHEARFPPFNRTVRAIERRATKRILRDFLASDLADLAANELVPRHFEYRFGAKHRDKADHPEPFLVHAGGVPVRVEGTIDRIDFGAARLRIVDYKSGKALRHVNLPDKIDRGVRLQLALYALAAAEFFSAEPAGVSGTIKPLVVDGKPKFAFELSEKRDGVLETLQIFIRAIMAGLFPAFPNDNDAEFNSCKYCPVNHSCRTRHDQEERYAIQRQRDPRTLLSGGLGGGAP